LHSQRRHFCFCLSQSLCCLPARPTSPSCPVPSCYLRPPPFKNRCGERIRCAARVKNFT
jgi:hypothetical protein